MPQIKSRPKKTKHHKQFLNYSKNEINMRPYTAMLWSLEQDFLASTSLASFNQNWILPTM
jgi:hypothetical protein